jgi:DNA polymerase (family 10)
MDNRTVAERLRRHAHDLEERGENLYRIQAYRRAAETLLFTDRPVEKIVAEGRLRQLPGIGRHLAYTIGELVRTGEFQTFRGRRSKRGGEVVASREVSGEGSEVEVGLD